MTHVPVLLNEVLRWLNLKPGDTVIDCTIGGAGHGRAMLELIGPTGRLLGIDLSKEAIRDLEKEFAEQGNRVVLVAGNFRDLGAIARAHGFKSAQAILMDLGFSSLELGNPKLGLSFQIKGPLDMRLSGQGTSAAEIVNGWSEQELTNLIRTYGEERYAREIAKAIVRSRHKKRILKTTELAWVIVEAVPKNYERGRIHPATRTFQALRIATNDELENLEAALPQAVELLGNGGRLAVISFHSLEDRMVKRFFRKESGGRLRILTKKPIQAGQGEIAKNPRSRSAKLRVAERI